jgi:hypothetical protein
MATPPLSPQQPSRKRTKPSIPGFDLRGRANTLNEHLQRKTETIAVRPINFSHANITNFWTFQFRARKNQWIRLKPDSLTVQVWGRMNNPDRNEQSLVHERSAEFWSLRAKTGQPQLFVDPTIQGTGFVKGVDVFINNVQVPTNGTLNNHLIHYTRVSRIFENTLRDKTFFGLHSDLTFQKTTREMTEATKMFHYHTWNSTRGVRVPVYLDGIFPFDFRNKTLQTLDDSHFETLYFPPETSFEIRVHLYKDHAEALFHQGMPNYGESYYSSEPANPLPAGTVLTYQDVCLEYESTELVPAEHVKAIQKFESGSAAKYPYDIPRVQYQTLPAGQSFTTNTFQIQPSARLFYLMFTPNWGTFVMDSKRKPLSGFSQFPRGATKIQLSFGSDINLITENMEDFGIRGTQHEIAKRIYYEYLTERKIFPGTFDQLFPPNPNDISTLQMFVYDLKHQMSQKTELLTVQCTFGQGDTSPQDLQLICISVHPTGQATCTFNSHSSDYIWSFNHTS